MPLVLLLLLPQNALVPVLVRGMLANHVADHLACGMSHVAVVATQRTKGNSSNGSVAATRLLTWGRNSAGQLGIGAGREDHFMPQVRRQGEAGREEGREAGREAGRRTGRTKQTEQNRTGSERGAMLCGSWLATKSCRLRRCCVLSCRPLNVPLL